MSEIISQEQFLSDITDHSMTVIRDDGVNRHLSFSDNGSFDHKFDLITWAGHLCYTGDCGTYVFERVNDMFAFFRNEHPENGLKIAPAYWGEKLEAVDKVSGFMEFSETVFKERVTQFFNNFWEDDAENAGIKQKCWEEINDEVLNKAEDGEVYAYAAVNDYYFRTPDGIDDFYFQDFFDGGGTEQYTHRYIWCLYAIVYAITEYDKSKDAEKLDNGSKLGIAC